MPLASNSAYVDLLMARLGSRVGTTLRARCVDELNVQKDVLEAGSFLPWFLETTTSLSIPAGTSERALPTGFLREIESRRMVLTDDATGVQYWLRKRRPEQLQYWGMNQTEPEIPRRYTITGEALVLWPAADTNYTLTFPYMAKSSAILDDGSLNVWFQHAPDYLIGMAGSTLAQFHIRNPELVRSFLELSGRARTELIMAHSARIDVNTTPSSSDDLIEEFD